MRVVLCLALALVMLAGCGIRKPLIRPKDIPAYEQKRERKREGIEQDEQNAPDRSIEDEAATEHPASAPATTSAP